MQVHLPPKESQNQRRILLIKRKYFKSLWKCLYFIKQELSIYSFKKILAKPIIPTIIQIRGAIDLFSLIYWFGLISW